MSKIFTVNDQYIPLTSIVVSSMLTLNKRYASLVLLETIGVQYLEIYTWCVAIILNLDLLLKIFRSSGNFRNFYKLLRIMLVNNIAELFLESLNALDIFCILYISNEHFRSRLWNMFCKKGFLKRFVKFTEKLQSVRLSS